jgi:hypothetical protein
VGQAAHEPQVLAAREVLVNGGVLPGEADALAHRLRVAGDVEPDDLGHAGVGLEDRGEDANGGGLAGAVGPEEPVDGPRGDQQVDSGEGVDRAEALRQGLGPNRRLGGHVEHRGTNP